MKQDMRPTEPEFSLSVAIDKIPAGGIEKVLEANAEERRRLAERFGLIDLPMLRADLTVRLVRAGAALEVTGSMTADVVQACVVSLEPVPAHIEQEIDVLCADEKVVHEHAVQAANSQSEIDGEDVELIVNGQIDLGELVAQHLGVSLDPYPRKAGIAFEGAEFGTSRASVNPFTKLAELKKKAPDKSGDKG